MSVFGGEKKNNLCLSLGNNYLHDRKPRGSEECKPILASLSGKALGYCDEFPHGELNADTVKPLIVQRGGSISARFGGAKESQST
eukprot:7557268-Karenia_brevis.AAC.1